MIQRLLDLLLGLPSGAVYLVIGALAAVENIFPPVPADTAVAVGAFLSSGGRISAWSVFWVTLGSNAATAVVVYGLAYRVGRPFFSGPLGRHLLKPRALERIEAMYHRYGTWAIFFSRFIPGVRAVVPPFAGVARLAPRRTIPPLVIASALWYGAITFSAATLIREADEIAELIRRFNRGVLFAVGAIVVTGVVTWFVRRRVRAGRNP